ncbi:MAG TPA: transposase [Polyangiaceae bacterium]
MSARGGKACPKQLTLALPTPPPPAPTWGGKRAGAGRKPARERARVRHAARPKHAHAHPVHVVLRSKFRPLRSQFTFPTVERALARATRARLGFRIVHFSMQADHLHLIVEASDQRALSRGMQGLAIRIARQLNKLVNRSGKVWADRFFARALTSPRSVRNALAYVLNNFRKHRARGAARIDPYSSAPYFDGFRELRGLAPRDALRTPTLPLAPRGLSPPKTANDAPVVSPRTWLARIGWRRAGLLAI